MSEGIPKEEGLSGRERRNGLFLKQVFKELLAKAGYRLERTGGKYPVTRPIDTNGVEILADPEFQKSCRMIDGLSLLDTPRLANLWMLARLTDPSGAMAEIGTYRGGGALHLSNCCPDRPMVVCDPFAKESFQGLDPRLDKNFHLGQFSDHGEEPVRCLFKGRKAMIVRGYFPQSVAAVTLPMISFVHLDVDVYAAIKESLDYLLAPGRLCANSLIVLDDYNRLAEGVNKVVDEILARHAGTMVFPLFPGQALVVPATWRQGAGAASKNAA